MRVRVTTILTGPGPSEAVIAIKTRNNGDEEVIVDRDQIHDGTLQVSPIGKGEQGGVLVELPQESTNGNRRLWIDEREVA